MNCAGCVNIGNQTCYNCSNGNQKILPHCFLCDNENDKDICAECVDKSNFYPKDDK